MTDASTAAAGARPRRILHVISWLSRGGVETWLKQIVRHIDRDRFHIDFLVHRLPSQAYEDEVRAHGCGVIHCPRPSRPLCYGARLYRLLKQHGPYDAIHSHLHLYSGWVLQVARLAGIKTRIAHSHNDTRRVQREAGFVRRRYQDGMAFLIQRNATLGFGCSSDAASALFDDDWSDDPRWHVLLYGIETEPFAQRRDRAEVRAEFGLSPDDLVIGHVGTFSAQKNHRFLLDIAGALVRKAPGTRFLLVGDGVLRADIEARADQLGLTDAVIFAGLRSDVARLMVDAFDVFLLPSLHEGVAMVLLETQASGTPIVCSDVIPHEADLVKPLMHRVPLSASPDAWADRILAAREPAIARDQARDIVKNSKFSIRSSVAALESFYAA